jgi:hypothetical protein
MLEPVEAACLSRHSVRARQMTGSFSLDKVGPVAIVARLKKCSGDAVLRYVVADLTPVFSAGRLGILPEARSNGVVERAPSPRRWNTAIKLQFGKENAHRRAGCARSFSERLTRQQEE